MTSRELQAKLAAAMRLIDMTERLLTTDSDLDRLWYGDMIKDELDEFRTRFDDGGQ